MSRRSLLIGTAWVALQSAVAPYSNYYARGSSLGGNLPLAPLVLLALILLPLNVALRRSRRGRPLVGSELAIVWIMTAVASVIPLRGVVAYLVPLLASPLHYATPENDWRALLVSALPSWAYVSNELAAHAFFDRPVGGARPVPWEAWLVPLAFWTAFVLAAFAGLFCLCAILRRPWVERERFSFPLARVPLEIITSAPSGPSAPSLLARRALWVGVAVPVVLHTVNGLHHYIPSVPELPTVYNLSRGATARPWTALRAWPAIVVMVFPCVIGVGYLLPLEISFSFWFFFLLFKAQYVLIQAFSVPVGAWTSASRQSMGSMLVVGFMLAWTARGHIASGLRRLLSPSAAPADDDYIPQRSAAAGLAVAATLMVVLLVRAGVSAHIAVVVMGVYLLVSTVLTWMVANGGMLVVQAPFYPTDYVRILFGARAVGLWAIPVLGIPQHSPMRGWEQLAMPHMMHGLYIGRRSGIGRSGVTLALAVAVVVSLVVGYIATLRLGYAEGASTFALGGRWFSETPFRRAASSIRNPQATQWPEVYSLLLGAVATVAMVGLRHRFVGFQLHPIGYAVGASSAPYFLWSSLFIAWGVKSLLIRIGGPKTYHEARPLFLGLVLGDYLMAGMWTVVGAATG
ncbi:hypothetical protein HN937_19665, partial [Candidatus Poribacteria bacterium]|nr:hypothetical protein [Candidatus Poribacteria bacterium]